MIPDMTTLFTALHCGEKEGAPVYGAGELRFDLKNASALVKSMEVEGTSSLAKKVAAYAAFASFAYGALRDEYLKGVELLYDTRYENLVLSGRLQAINGKDVPFFLVSGVHDRGFPWGDAELFWDVLLVIGDGQGGHQRYCISDRVLEGLSWMLSEEFIATEGRSSRL